MACAVNRKRRTVPNDDVGRRRRGRMRGKDTGVGRHVRCSASVHEPIPVATIVGRGRRAVQSVKKSDPWLRRGRDERVGVIAEGRCRGRRQGLRWGGAGSRNQNSRLRRTPLLQRPSLNDTCPWVVGLAPLRTSQRRARSVGGAGTPTPVGLLALVPTCSRRRAARTTPARWRPRRTSAENSGVFTHLCRIYTEMPQPIVCNYNPKI
jgi:hypothetical protein